MIHLYDEYQKIYRFFFNLNIRIEKRNIKKTTTKTNLSIVVDHRPDPFDDRRN